jgi:cytochrome c biogenesis protein CcmG/thiol:disulfide interchange protein DsbE
LSGVPRSRMVLYSALGVGLLVAALIGVLAASKPVAQGSGTSPLIGQPAPPISGAALNGNGRYSLSEFSGKWVLVNFSASWCVPCREETPQLQLFWRQHQGPGDAVVLAVSYDPSDQASLASFLKSSRATWPAVIDPAADVSYGVSGIPESYLIDPAGRVVARFLGGITAAEVNAALQSR